MRRKKLTPEQKRIALNRVASNPFCDYGAHSLLKPEPDTMPDDTLTDTGRSLTALVREFIGETEMRSGPTLSSLMFIYRAEHADSLAVLRDLIIDKGHNVELTPIGNPKRPPLGYMLKVSN